MRVTTPLRIAFGPAVCTSLAEGGDREWLVADGCGGYAMGTVCGLRTRRYHGLLVPAVGGPSARRLGLVALDPVLELPSGVVVRLGVHEWAGGVVAPAGHTYLESFDLDDGLPRWRWRVGAVVLERELAMRHGSASVAVMHRLITGGPVHLTLEALVTWRDAHGERYANGSLSVQHGHGGAVIEDAFRLRGPGWVPAGDWYRGVHARLESQRGLPAQEDVWLAGRFSCELSYAGDTLPVSAWAGNLTTEPPPAADVVAAGRQRARNLVTTANPTGEVAARLVLAADAFITTKPDVVAGYPWFGAWSRDTMTSYEGLFLATGRGEEGRALLRGYAATVSEGMLANTADTGSTEYNTADATLWFVHAIDRHVTATGDLDLAAALVPVLDGVIKAHLQGTRYGIRVDPADGLLTQGQPGYALTWMDARVDGIGVTPRIGKAVEINALWVNGLAALRALHTRLGADPPDVATLHERARTSFATRLPLPGGGLHDVVDGPAGDDTTVRPNQLLAYSLPHAPLSKPGAVGALASALLTPLGLRSLAPGSPGYRGQHRGGPRDRDNTYHQGTVWPWLIGPYIDACRNTGAPTNDALTGLSAHLAEWGLGSVSETAEGDPPHPATGCPFQAWSVAELHRVIRL